jgi:ABC-type branched-subunit amino acid transport system ATPase component/branched-subunit amino acid ABC-type transport system permease component
MLPFIIGGLVTGSVYGLIGVGVVLTYRTSGIFNFAYGALGSVAAYIWYFLHVEHGWPLVPTLLLCLLVVAPATAYGMERMSVNLLNASLALQIAATVGLLLVVEGLSYLLFGPAQLEFPEFLPTTGIQVGGLQVGWDQIITFAVSLLGTLGLFVYLRRARMGKSMLAVVDNAELLSLAGTNPIVVRRWAWVISCFLVMLSGLLLAPSVGLTPTSLTLLVIQGFGAAAIGGFASIPLTWVGGLLIGVGAALVTEYTNSPTGSVLAGLSVSLPFLVLFAVILFFPKRRLISVGSEVGKMRNLNPTWTFPAAFQFVIGAAVIVLLVLVPSFAGFRLDGWSTTLTYVMLLLSVGLLVRSSGQVSLCQVTFAAIGAVAFHDFTSIGIPWGFSLVLAALAAMPIGALLAVPAIRLPGLFLALATFGFGLLVQDMFYQTNVMFGSTGAGVAIPVPSGASDNTVYYLILIITVLIMLFVVLLARTRLGRLLRALSDSPIGLSAQGTNVTVVRVVVFCIAAFIAAISGALIGVVQTDVSSYSFDPNTSLLLLALVVITIGGEPWYALIAAVGLGLIPAYFSGADVTYSLDLLFGVFAILVAILPPARMPVRWRAAIDRVGRRRRTKASGQAEPAPVAPQELAALAVHSPTSVDEVLDVADIAVSFGGLRAVDHLSFTARTGQITGLVGPNGAGKSTSFNVCSGLVSPDAGTVTWRGRDLTRLGPSRRAQLGIGRTFQQMELFESMTVEQNVALGREAAFAGSNVMMQVISTRSERREIKARTAAAIQLCGLEKQKDATVGDLSTGQRRLVELARCLTGNFDLLLLDEPSSGLDEAETTEFGDILARVVSERGLGILLVEHDMSLVMRVCAYIYVLDFGRKIFEGTPVEVQKSDVVKAAYLGSDTVEIDAAADEYQTTGTGGGA